LAIPPNNSFKFRYKFSFLLYPPIVAKGNAGIKKPDATGRDQSEIDGSIYGVLEDITAQLNKRVDLFEISELSRNAAICSAVEQEGIVLYDR
jgi:hypothetical protein